MRTEEENNRLERSSSGLLRLCDVRFNTFRDRKERGFTQSKRRKQICFSLASRSIHQIRTDLNQNKV